MPQIVPLTSDPSILFNITLGGIELNFQTKFNTRRSVWEVDIYDADNVQLAYGVTLVLGANIISALNLRIGSLLVVDLIGRGRDATSSNLGTEVVLTHFNEGELEQVQLEQEVENV